MRVGGQAVDLGELVVDDLEPQLLIDERESDRSVAHERRETSGRRPQDFLGARVIVDVGDRADPFTDLVVVADQRNGTYDRPPIAPRGRVAQASAAFPRTALPAGLVQSVEYPAAVFMVQRVEPSVIARVSIGLSGIRRPRVVSFDEAALG